MLDLDDWKAIDCAYHWDAIAIVQFEVWDWSVDVCHRCGLFVVERVGNGESFRLQR